MTKRLLPLDLQMCGSVERGEAVIDWVLANIKRANKDKAVEELLGHEFWKVVRNKWSSFDRINHQFYEHMFRRLRPYWKASSAELALPETAEVWRGQNRLNQQFGLSWTTDRKIAEGFARGFRYRNPDPVLYTTEVKSTDVALVLDDRSEAEFVLFEAPKDFEEVLVQSNEQENLDNGSVAAGPGVALKGDER